MVAERSQQSGPERVLIAEDSPTQAEQLRSLLEDGGYLVDAAGNGREALELARANPPNLVISDVNMPEVDGYDFCRAFKADAQLRDIPFMLVTSLSAPSDVVHGLECGADNFITKPYEEVTLLQRVRHLLTNSALRGSSRVRTGVEIDLGGKVHFITAQRQQILDLLISTYSEAVRLSEEAVKRGEKLRESYEIMSVLQRSAEQLNKVRTEQEVVTEALACVRDLPFCRAAWILLTDDDGMLERAAESGLNETEAAGLGSRTICACQRDAHLGKLGSVAQIESCSRLSGSASPGACAHASIPLAGQQRNFGILNAFPKENRPFAADELSILSGLGSQISAALDRAHLNTNLERKVEARTQELRREIAIRQQAETAAVAATARLDRAQRVGHVGSAELNLITHQDFWSDEFYRLIGLTPGSVKPSFERVREAIHPDDKDKWSAIHARSRQGQLSEPVELRFVRPNGEIRWLYRHGEVILDSNGQPLNLAVSYQDITERKRAEEDLRESRAHLELAQRVGRIGSAEVDVATGHEVWSEEHYRIFGVPVDAGPKTPDYFFSFVHPADREGVAEATARSARGEEVGPVEFRIVRPDGAERQILAQRHVVRDASGAPTKLLITNQDVTEQKEAAEALRLTDERLRLLVDTVKDYAIIMLNSHGRVITWNEGARKIKGYAEGEIVGQSTSVFYPPEDVATGKPAQLLEAAATLGRSEDQGWRVRKDGSRFFANMVLTALRDKDGTLKGFAKITRDITESRNLEEQLRQSQKMEAVGNLTGGIAHDFNNILSVAIGNLDLLKMEIEGGSEADTLVDTAIAACLKGSELTKSLLAFSRRQPLQPRRTNINKLLGDSTKMLSRALGESVQVHLKLGDGLWDIMVDPSLLESALLNMMVNSRDAMPEGGHIIIESRNTNLDEAYAAQNAEVKIGDYVVLEVSDTGTGMPPEVLLRVFEPFFTTKEKGKGTGLGLAMVFGFVKQSEGHIKIYSEVGHGTTIRIYLPRIDKAEDGAADIDRRATVTLSNGHESILVVEDNPAVRRAVCKQLKGAGYHITEADSAVEAVKVLEGGLTPDLIFTDVIMPGGMTGADLARESSKRWPQIKVLLTSGFPEGLLESGNKLPPGTNLLSKPYRREDLLRKLREVFDTPPPPPNVGDTARESRGFDVQ